MAFRIIRTAELGVLETFGKFTRCVEPGIRFYLPFIQRVKRMTLRQQKDDFHFGVKTQDNVFAKIHLSVQHKIVPEDVQTATYSLDHPIEQMESLIDNAVRALVPTLTLDALFAAQDAICRGVSEHVAPEMKKHGYTLVRTLVTEIEPAGNVRDAMNQINAAQRLKEAAQFKADAEYIQKVREAEAERDRRELIGQGIARQRKAILDGYQAYVHGFADQFGMGVTDVMRFVLEMQEIETKAGLITSTNAKTVFLGQADRASRALFGAIESQTPNSSISQS